MSNWDTDYALWNRDHREAVERSMDYWYSWRRRPQEQTQEGGGASMAVELQQLQQMYNQLSSTLTAQTTPMWTIQYEREREPEVPWELRVREGL